MVVDKLIEAIKDKKSPCVVGIDPEWGKLPRCYREMPEPKGEVIWKWARDVIDTVAEIVPAVKPQMAFFEAFGADGIRAHQRIVQYAHEKGLIVIDDSKRGDIGNTAKAYAFAHLAKDGPINADFLTISPFLGTDSLQPFLDVAHREGKGLFVLVKTSNPGSGEIADAKNDRGERIMDRLADFVCRMAAENRGRWGYSGIGAVVGATFPQEARALRQRMPHSFFLVPGFGAQGGSAADVVPCFNPDGLGAVVNSSRGILYHHLAVADYDGTKEMYLRIVKKQAETMRQAIYQALKAACPDMQY